MSAKMPQVPVNYPSRPCSALDQVSIPRTAPVTNNFNQPSVASCRFQEAMRPPPDYSYAISSGYNRHGMSPSTVMAIDDSSGGVVQVQGHCGSVGTQFFDASPTFQTAHPVQEMWSPNSPFSSPFGSSSTCSEEYFHPAAGSSLDVRGGVDARFKDIQGHVLPNTPADVKSQLRSVLQARSTTTSSEASTAASTPRNASAAPSFFPAPFPSICELTSTATVQAAESAGLSFPGVVFNPSGMLEEGCSKMRRWNLSRNEELKRMKRRERNKVAATKCRNKKKERQGNLVKEADLLENQHKYLKDEQRKLLGEKDRLVALLEGHKISDTNCPLRHHHQQKQVPDPPHSEPNDHPEVPTGQVKQEGNPITMSDEVAQSDPPANTGQSSPSSLLDQAMTSDEQPFETHNFDWFVKEETSGVGNDGYPSFDSSGSSPLAPPEDNLHGFTDRDFPQYFPSSNFRHESFDAKYSFSPQEDIKEFDPLTDCNQDSSVLDLDNQQVEKQIQQTWPSSELNRQQQFDSPTLSAFDTDCVFESNGDFFGVSSLVNGIHQSVWETV